MKNRVFTQQEDELIKRIYATTPMYELLELLPGHDDTDIRNRAYKLGASSKDKSAKISLSRSRPSHLDTFFQDANNIHAAFIAGLWASDGNVHIDKKNNYPSLVLKLKEDDKDYLEGIRDFLGIDKNLNFVRRGPGTIEGRKVNIQNQYVLSVYSVKTAVKHLEENFNITPNKTLSLQPPNISDLQAKIAYTVGYIDGDGSIYTSCGTVKGKSYCYNKLSIYGQRPVLEWMQNEVFGVLNPQTKNLKIKINKKSGLHSLTISESSLTSYLHEVDRLGLPKMERKWSILSRREKTGTRHENRHGQSSAAKLTLENILKELGVGFDEGFLGADFYFPRHKLAIMINDESIPELNKRNVAFKRKEKFKEEGIKLIQYWSGSILEKRDLIKSMIKNALGLMETKIYARKCEVREVSSKVYREFLNNNHIEGERNSSIRFGLYHNNELVSVMGFSEYKEHFELDRFCSLMGVVVMGGFSKLFKRKPVGKKIVSYSFNSYSDGNVYRVNNFIFSRLNKNSLYYFHDGVLKNRNGFMKYKLAEKLNIDNVSLYTERDLAGMVGAHPVFDAGTSTWVFD